MERYIPESLKRYNPLLYTKYYQKGFALDFFGGGESTTEKTDTPPAIPPKEEISNKEIGEYELPELKDQDVPPYVEKEETPGVASVKVEETEEGFDKGLEKRLEALKEAPKPPTQIETTSIEDRLQQAKDETEQKVKEQAEIMFDKVKQEWLNERQVLINEKSAYEKKLKDLYSELEAKAKVELELQPIYEQAKKEEYLKEGYLQAEKRFSEEKTLLDIKLQSLTNELKTKEKEKSLIEKEFNSKKEMLDREYQLKVQAIEQSRTDRERTFAEEIASKQQMIQKEQEALKFAKEQKEKIQQDLAATEAQKNDAAAKVMEMEGRVAELTREFEFKKQDLLSFQDELRKKESQIVEQTSEMALLKGRLATIDVEKQTSEQLLSQKDDIIQRLANERVRSEQYIKEQYNLQISAQEQKLKEKQDELAKFTEELNQREKAREVEIQRQIKLRDEAVEKQKEESRLFQERAEAAKVELEKQITAFTNLKQEKETLANENQTKIQDLETALRKAQEEKFNVAKTLEQEKLQLLQEKETMAKAIEMEKTKIQQEKEANARIIEQEKLRLQEEMRANVEKLRKETEEKMKAQLEQNLQKIKVQPTAVEPAVAKISVPSPQPVEEILTPEEIAKIEKEATEEVGQVFPGQTEKKAFIPLETPGFKEALEKIRAQNEKKAAEEAEKRKKKAQQEVKRQAVAEETVKEFTKPENVAKRKEEQKQIEKSVLPEKGKARKIEPLSIETQAEQPKEEKQPISKKQEIENALLKTAVNLKGKSMVTQRANENKFYQEVIQTLQKKDVSLTPTDKKILKNSATEYAKNVTQKRTRNVPMSNKQTKKKVKATPSYEEQRVPITFS